jgi:hypothetical protein
MAQFERPKRDVSGMVVETPHEATQAENSKGSFNVLTVSMILAIVAGIGLAWYFGILPWGHHPHPVQPG